MISKRAWQLPIGQILSLDPVVLLKCLDWSAPSLVLLSVWVHVHGKHDILALLTDPAGVVDCINETFSAHDSAVVGLHNFLTRLDLLHGQRLDLVPAICELLGVVDGVLSSIKMALSPLL